jgi:protein-S-isoprenylcysteine O-methyltransferase Ste14
MTVQTQQAPAQTDIRAGVRKWVTKTAVMTVVVAVLLFASAGRIDWINGWAYMALLILIMGVNALVLIPRSPDLIAERSGPQKGSKRWDVVMSSVINVLGSFALWIVAGLDTRFEGSPALPAVIPITAWIVAAAGGLFTTWAMATNRFFSAVIRIQDDRGHHVIDSGPYRWVRHPGYVGSFAYNLAAPLLLNALWAYIPVGIVLVLMVIRTALEDRTLRRELDGYEAYARRVRYRLLPGVW